MDVFATWIVYSNKYSWFPTLGKQSSNVKTHYRTNKFLNRMFCIKWKKCFSRSYIVILNTIFLTNSAMPSKTIKDNPQMYMNKWILMNFQVFFLIGLKIKSKGLPIKILLKISLEVCFLIKLFVKAVHTSHRQRNLSCQSAWMWKRRRIFIRALMRW